MEGRNRAPAVLPQGLPIPLAKLRGTPTGGRAIVVQTPSSLFPPEGGRSQGAERSVGVPPPSLREISKCDCPGPAGVDISRNKFYVEGYVYDISKQGGDPDRRGPCAHPPRPPHPGTGLRGRFPAPSDPYRPEWTGMNRNRPRKTGIDREKPGKTGKNRDRPGKTGIDRHGCRARALNGVAPEAAAVSVRTPMGLADRPGRSHLEILRRLSQGPSKFQVRLPWRTGRVPFSFIRRGGIMPR